MVLMLSLLFLRNQGFYMHGNPIKITIQQRRNQLGYHNILCYLVILPFISHINYHLLRNHTHHHYPFMKKIEKKCRLLAFQNRNNHMKNLKNLCLLKNQQVLRERNHIRQELVQDHNVKREKFLESIGVQRKVNLSCKEVKDQVLVTF